MEIPSVLVSDKKLLLIWHSGSTTETIQQVVESLRRRTGPGGVVQLEHAERLLLGEDKQKNKP